MKRILILVFLASVFTSLQAQEEVKLYDPELNGMEQIDKAVKQAESTNKNAQPFAGRAPQLLSLWSSGAFFNSLLVFVP